MRLSASIFSSARMRVTSTGCVMYGSPLLRTCAPARSAARLRAQQRTCYSFGHARRCSSYLGKDVTAAPPETLLAPSWPHRRLAQRCLATVRSDAPCLTAHLARVRVVRQEQRLLHLAALLGGQVAQQRLQAPPQVRVRDLLRCQRLIELRARRPAVSGC